MSKESFSQAIDAAIAAMEQFTRVLENLNVQLDEIRKETPSKHCHAWRWNERIKAWKCVACDEMCDVISQPCELHKDCY